MKQLCKSKIGYHYDMYFLNYKKLYIVIVHRAFIKLTNNYKRISTYNMCSLIYIYMCVCIYIYFYPSAWADERIRQEFKSVIAGWITSYGYL